MESNPKQISGPTVHEIYICIRNKLIVRKKISLRKNPEPGILL